MAIFSPLSTPLGCEQMAQLHRNARETGNRCISLSSFLNHQAIVARWALWLVSHMVLICADISNSEVPCMNLTLLCTITKAGDVLNISDPATTNLCANDRC
jgi:hypothetical protein